MALESITLDINGARRTLAVSSGARLVDALRALGLTGVKEGCGEGECGACTVLLDGRPVNSCLVFARQAEGRAVVTVEGVGRGHPDGLHPVQRALIAAGGVQCGFCTPGIVVSAAHLAATRPAASERAVREALAGHLCRCTGYVKIVEAVRTALAEIAAAGATPPPPPGREGQPR